VLVISETFPRADGDCGFQKLLLALLALGYEVTFVARESLNRQRDESALQNLGIPTYADDNERIHTLGKTANGTQSWCLERVLSETKFDIAILTEDFAFGLSVPEQYLNVIRHRSEKTRVIVWTNRVYQSLQRPAARNRRAIQDFEKNQNRAHRQKESFEKADLVLLSAGDGVISLLAGKEMRNLGACCSDSVSRAIDEVHKTLPRSPSGSFSIMQVESLFEERLSALTGLRRVQAQLECYVILANLLAHENKLSEAREQLRHVFGRMDGSWDAAEFVTNVMVLLRRCYRMLGESELAETYCEAARDSAMVSWANTPLAPPKRTSTNAPLISLIVPTYNRLPILRKCLAALEAQTLPKGQFEVIVIDDGSIDGSEHFLRRYRPPFRFQYLRQNNSGTGAARRHGVSQAAGEFLLLMNDDTICDPDLVQQHLEVQNKLGSQRWAVLGSFEYPAEACHRALTHYFCVEPFMFPQVSMEEGCPYGYSHFITCNLSVRRDAVIDVGSFASIYRLSEDTEMGLRLFEKGFHVIYHPAAHAWHDHLPYPAGNLIRRARVYGADYFHMFRRHPRVMKEWAMPVPLTAMDEANATRILAYVEANRKDVEEAVQALKKWDDVDFASLLEKNAETVAMVLSLFRQAVPAIHWFYLYETMFQTMVRELNLVHLASSGNVASMGAALSL
jgi:glycosyltransferase involved in cell wall biosynthesis